MSGKHEGLDPAVHVCIDHIDDVLDAAYHRMGVQAPRHNGRPVLVMVRDALPPPNDEELIIWLEAWGAFLTILFAEGASPLKVLKRLFAFVWAVRRELLVNMTQTELGLLMGETRAAVSHRVNVVYSDYLKRMGFRGTRLPGQKSETSRETFARKAAGNTSRASGRKAGECRSGTGKKKATPARRTEVSAPPSKPQTNMP